MAGQGRRRPSSRFGLMSLTSGRWCSRCLEGVQGRRLKEAGLSSPTRLGTCRNQVPERDVRMGEMKTIETKETMTLAVFFGVDTRPEDPS